MWAHGHRLHAISGTADSYHGLLGLGRPREVATSDNWLTQTRWPVCCASGLVRCRTMRATSRQPAVREEHITWRSTVAGDLRKRWSAQR